MPSSTFSDSLGSIQAKEFEQLIQDSIIAVKNGDRAMAKRLLDQAALINSADARIWIWLSATTDDLQERRDYLEHAVAVDPSNATAKRGLMLLTEKLKETELMPEGASYSPQEEEIQEEAKTKLFQCPNCGASISYEINDAELVCQFCGFKRKIDERVINESTDQVLDTALPTTRAHRWVDSQARITCEQCGAVILLPHGQTADSCPYCASNRFISTQTLMELIDPQVIGVFSIDPQKAERSVKTWLGKGIFAPDDLALKHAGMQLHPAYYPFWIFSGTLEVPWFCDVNMGTGKLAAWEAHTGSEFEMFQNILIPGLKKISWNDLAGIEPFSLKDLVEFSPDYLAGWLAFTYDRPLADASLAAREKVVKVVQRALPGKVEANRSKRNFSIGAGKWSDLTYKLALLPIYIGNYPFQGKRFRLLVNGQTGKVYGNKPVDNIKVTMLVVGGFILLAIFSVLLTFILKRLTG